MCLQSSVCHILHVIPRAPTPPRLTAASGSGCPLCAWQHPAAPRSPFLLCSPGQQGAPRGEQAGRPALPHRRTGRTGSSGDSASAPLALLLRQHSPSPGGGLLIQPGPRCSALHLVLFVSFWFLSSPSGLPVST